MQKRQLTPFGIEVSIWCVKRGISKKELAKRAGVKNDTLIKAIWGYIPGKKAQKKVREYMNEHDGD